MRVLGPFLKKWGQGALKKPWRRNKWVPTPASVRPSVCLCVNSCVRPQALNFRGRLKLLHGQSRVSEDGTLVPPQLALFSIATPLQPPSILEIRTKTLIFQTKHKLDFTPMGIDTRWVYWNVGSKNGRKDLTSQCENLWRNWHSHPL